MWAKKTSSRDNWERLVAAVIKRDQIRQLCHQDSITTVDSDFSDRDLRSLSSAPSPQLPLARNSVVQVWKGGSGTFTHKLFSALPWRKKLKGLADIPVDEVDSFEFKVFSPRELLVATNHFGISNIIGGNRFGELYIGKFADGSLVAVKRLNAQVSNVMIRNELKISSIVAHRNVMALLGHCINEKERLLVYPYTPNGSVAQCLRKRSKSQSPLEWAIRPRIALGVARGLAYLHHGCFRGIIHCNINGATIMLDEYFEALVSFFTLAKFVDCNDEDTAIVKGKFGYIAPKCISMRICSLKTGVYAYGVFVLELISGKPPSELMSIAYHDYVMLIDWVMKLWEEKKIEALIDQFLGGDFVEEEVNLLLQIALICIQIDSERRPTISQVVKILEDEHDINKAWEEMINSYEMSVPK